MIQWKNRNYNKIRLQEWLQKLQTSDESNSLAPGPLLQLIRKIALYCRVLKVSRQGFYRYLSRRERPWKYQRPADAMREIHDEDVCNDAYGRKRMHQTLLLKQPEGVDIPSERTVYRVMKEIGLVHHPRRRPNGITRADREARKSDDLLKRFFSRFGRIICVSIIRQKPAIAQKSAEIFLNTKVSSIISVCTVLNVNRDVMLENANTRKIYALSFSPFFFLFPFPFPEKPLEKCVTDITELKAKDGRLYVSAIFDCFDLTVLGLAMDDNMRAELCVRTLDSAAASYPALRGSVVHSDRGSQYTSGAYRAALEKHGIRQSMNSDGGRCHDNARCESMWTRMKCELFYDRITPGNMTVEQLKTLIWRFFISYCPSENFV